MFVLRPVGAAGAQGDAAPERPHMRAVGRSAADHSTFRVRDGRRVECGHVRRSGNASRLCAGSQYQHVSSGLDVPTPATRTRTHGVIRTRGRLPACESPKEPCWY